MLVKYTGFSNDEKVFSEIREKRLPVIIGGEGNLAEAAERMLRQKGFDEIFHVLIDTSDYDIRIISDVPYKEFVFFHGFLESYALEPERFSKINGCRGVYYLSEIYGTEKITYPYYIDHENEFELIYRLLEDEISKDSLKAYLNAKVNEDAKGLHRLVEKPQYFGGAFLQVPQNGYFVDCGAYQGDSVCDYVNWTKGKYKGIMAFEPEHGNAEKLKEYIKREKLHDVAVIEKGAYDKAVRLCFSTCNEMSRIQEKGDAEIYTETIDKAAGDTEVTFIKMDIEGAELQALKGAEKIIQKYHPVLAVSAYHKASDLIDLSAQIRNYYNGYRFYFRLHKEIPIDAVLYAVPY